MDTDDDELVRLADAVAERAHRGQVDKAGAPYVGHPRRVAARLSDPAHVAVALLHDVVEDTGATLDDLRALGLPDLVVDAVDALTKRPGETLRESMRRVAANPVAASVKRADVSDNLSPERVARLDDATRERLEGKYERTLRFLAEAERDARPGG